jgi:hypothetical protein
MDKLKLTDDTRWTLMSCHTRGMIPYRPQHNEVTGSVNATLLLQQIIWHFEEAERKPFPKFRKPCQHEDYCDGESWTEELGFGKSEFDTALSRIGTKITHGVSKAEMLKKTDPTGLVLYWTDHNRTTWYMVNVELAATLGIECWWHGK